MCKPNTKYHSKFGNPWSFLLLVLLLGCGDKDGGGKSVTLSVVLSDSTDSNVTAGECVAFTLTGSGTTFLADGLEIRLAYNDGELLQSIPDAVGIIEAQPLIEVVSDVELRIGQPGTEGKAPCWCLGPGPFTGCQVVPSGPVDVVVQDGEETLTIQDAFNVKARSPAALSDAGVEVLDRMADINYYTQLVSNLAVVLTVRSTGTKEFLPLAKGYGQDFSASLAVGTYVALRDFSSLATNFNYRPVVSDLLLAGGEGYQFEVDVSEYAIVTKDSGGDTTGDPFDVNVGGVYKASLAGMTNDYNPNPGVDLNDERTWTEGCTSQLDSWIHPTRPVFFPIVGAGKDAVFKYKPTASGFLLLAVQSEGDGVPNSGAGDFVLYATDDASTLSSGNCLAGSDLVGDVGTDSLLLDVTAGTTYFIIVDGHQEVSGADEFLFFLQEI